MSENQKKANKRKGYYLKAAKGKRQRLSHVLEAGQRGFLLTCNNREKQAVAEAYNLLNEYADQLYGPEEKAANNEEVATSAEVQGEGSDSEEDIESALQKEVSSLKEKKTNKHRFQVADSGANNCIFIKTTFDTPDEIVHAVFTDVHKTKSSKSRFIMRMQPVIGTCRADEAKLRALASDLLPKYFAQGETRTYCILIKVRNNNKFGKGKIFPILRDVIQEMNPNHDFDGENPDFVVSMDVIRSVCCISVMRDYYKFRKYNLQEVVKMESESGKPATSDNSLATTSHQDEMIKSPEYQVANSAKSDENTKNEHSVVAEKDSENQSKCSVKENVATTSQESESTGYSQVSTETLFAFSGRLKSLAETLSQMEQGNAKKENRDKQDESTVPDTTDKADGAHVEKDHSEVTANTSKIYPVRQAIDDLTDAECANISTPFMEQRMKLRKMNRYLAGVPDEEVTEDLIKEFTNIVESINDYMKDSKKRAEPDTLQNFSECIRTLVDVVKLQGVDLKLVRTSIKAIRESMDDIHDSTSSASGTEDHETLQVERTTRSIQSDAEHTRTHASFVDSVNHILECHTDVLKAVQSNPDQITEAFVKSLTEKIQKIINSLADKSQIMRLTAEKMEEIQVLLGKVKSHPEGVEVGVEGAQVDIAHICKSAAEIIDSAVKKFDTGENKD